MKKTNNEALKDFEREFVPHLGAAFNLARWLLKDSNDANDAVQDAYLRALRYFDGYRGSAGRAWLLTIVRNSCFALIETRATNRQQVELEAAAEELERHASPSAEVIVERGSDLRRVERCLAALPLEQREVIVLRELDGYTYGEISQIVGIPMGTVMSRLSRARAQLSKLLADDVEGASDEKL